MICYSSISFRPFWETKDSPESPCSVLSNVLLGGLLSFAVRPWQRRTLSPYTQNLRISIPPSDFVQSEKERVRQKALARRSQIYYFGFLHLSFWVFDSCVVRADSRVEFRVRVRAIQPVFVLEIAH